MKDKILQAMILVMLIITIAGFALGVHLFMTGFVIAICTLMGLTFLWIQFPRWLKLMITWTPLRWGTDVFVSLGIPFFMGATVTGITAGILMGLMVTILLRIEAKRLRGELRT